jgi:hypothetical protein
MVVVEAGYYLEEVRQQRGVIDKQGKKRATARMLGRRDVIDGAAKIWKTIKAFYFLPWCNAILYSIA